MATFADDMQVYLVAQAIGTYGTDLFINDGPDRGSLIRTVLREYGGAPADYTLDTTKVTHPRIQIEVKHPDHDTAQNKARAIYDALEKVVNKTVNGTRYIQVNMLSIPFPIEFDDMNRWRFTFNVEAEREEAMSW